jgi:DNA-3-methyladenine glycosylase
MRLTREFYLDDPRVVAKNLLGKELVRIINGEKIVCKIVETEAYGGVEDKGSHAFEGKRTKRTEPMFHMGGSIYVYLIYGMYHLLNIVTGEIEEPNAVLIRAVEPVKEIEYIKNNRKIKSNKVYDLTNGPGKLTQGLAIDMTFNERDIVNGDKLYIREGAMGIKDEEVIRTPRINIDYAEEYKDKPWRYYLKENPYVSK